MGSPLGPALANIFVGYQEAKLFNIAKRPLMYFRYVDDTFAVFNNEENCDTFLTHLNSLHPSLRFTYEKESNHSLPFLDVLVERHDSEFLTSVYRKPIFTGQYLRWNSFSPQKRKINLIDTLVHRAFIICSKNKLDPELGKIRLILLENGYPEQAINSAFKRKPQQLNFNLIHTVEKCPVYLYILWIGNVSMKFEKLITFAVKRCFFSVEPRVIFNTRQLLPATKKDKANIRSQLFHESVIDQHLLDNAQCALHYSNEKFSVLTRGCSSFHLSTLVATFIKSLNPLLCKQKEFVYSLKIS